MTVSHSRRRPLLTAPPQAPPPLPDEPFERLFREQFAPLVAASYRLCGDRGVAEDVVQGVFLKFYEGDGLARAEHPPAYLRRAVVTRTINAIRDRRRVDLPGEEAVWSAAEQAVAPPPSHLAGDNDRLHRAITQLPERARLILRLSRFEGYSHKEIAGQLGISPKTVENQLARALKLLRRYLPKTGLLSLAINLATL